MSFLYFRLVNTFQNFSIEAKPNNFFCQDVLALSREGQKTILLSSSTNFSPVTTQNTGTSPQNVLKFSAFHAAVKFQGPSSTNLLNMNQDHPSKTSFSGQDLQLY